MKYYDSACSSLDNENHNITQVDMQDKMSSYDMLVFVYLFFTIAMQYSILF